jgi:hypothetical protein
VDESVHEILSASEVTMTGTVRLGAWPRNRDDGRPAHRAIGASHRRGGEERVGHPGDDLRRAHVLADAVIKRCTSGRIVSTV